MHKLKLTDEAIDNLKRFNHVEQQLIARRIRAIFEIQDEKLILLTFKIGRRKNIYE